VEHFDFVRLVTRRWPVIVVTVLLGLFAGWFTAPGASDAPDEFAATTTLLSNPRSTAQLNLDQAALLATTGEVPVRVADELGLDGADAVKGRVDANADAETAAITVRAVHPDASQAEALSVAVAEELVDFIAGGDISAYEQQLEDLSAVVDQYRTQVDALNAGAGPGGLPADPAQAAELQAAQGQLASALASLQQLRTQGPPPGPLLLVEADEARPVEPEGVRAPDSKPARAALLGGFGLIVGLGAVVAIDRLDTRIRTKPIAEAASGARVLAEIPPMPGGRKRRDELFAVTDPSSPFVEAYRSLRSVAILGAEEDRPIVRGRGKVILVTSPGAGEGKTTTVAHLAAMLAEAGRSVLVVSADFRRPRLHQLFDVPREPGLSEALADPDGAPELRTLVRDTAVDDVRLLPSGSPTQQPAVLLRSIGQLFTAARTRYDFTIVDSAPLLVANDAAELAQVSDHVIVLARAGRTTVDAAQRAADVLDQLGADVLGSVLVGSTDTPSAYSYYRARYYTDAS
jgi:capsular exopolysaccharide synthesis family protein